MKTTMTTPSQQQQQRQHGRTAAAAAAGALFLLVVSVPDGASAFTTAPRRARSSMTQLASGFATDHYLNGLSDTLLSQAAPTGSSATDAYLNSLSQIATETSTVLTDPAAAAAWCPETYLTSLSEQFASATPVMDNNNLLDEQAILDSAGSLWMALNAAPSLVVSDAAEAAMMMTPDTTDAAATDAFLAASSFLETATEPVQSFVSADAVAPDWTPEVSLDVAVPDVAADVSSSSAFVADAVPTVTPDVDFSAAAPADVVMPLDAPQFDMVPTDVVPDVSSVADAANAADAVSTAVPDSALMSQLSGLSYDSFVDKAATGKAAAAAATTSKNILQQAAEAVQDAVSSAAESVENVVESVQQPKPLSMDEFVTAVQGTTEQVVTAATTTSDVAATTDSLASQLSGLSYDTAVASDVIEKVSTRAGGMDKLSSLAASSTAKLNSVAAGFSKATDAGAATVSKLFRQAGESISSVPKALLQQQQQAAAASSGSGSGATLIKSGAGLPGSGVLSSVTGSMESARNDLMTTSSNAVTSVKSVGDRSLADLGHSVVAGLKLLASMLLQILDKILESLSGTTVSEMVATAQASVQGVVNGAVDSVVTTLHNIGDMTVAQAAQSLVALLTLTANVLYTVLQAVVRVVSGKGLTDWAVAASNSVQQEASRLTAQAAATSYDLTHKSLYQLSADVGDFSHNIGRLMAETVSGSGAATAEVANQLAANGAVESVGSAMQLSQLF